jgi:hypothetical protein
MTLQGQCASPQPAALTHLARPQMPTVATTTSALRSIRTPATGSRHSLFATATSTTTSSWPSQVDSHAGSLPAHNSAIQPEAQNIVLTAVKKAEDSNALILRFYEWAGKDGPVRIRIPKGATSAELTNLLEDQRDAAVSIDGEHHLRSHSSLRNRHREDRLSCIFPITYSISSSRISCELPGWPSPRKLRLLKRLHDEGIECWIPIFSPSQKSK